MPLFGIVSLKPHRQTKFRPVRRTLSSMVKGADLVGVGPKTFSAGKTVSTFPLPGHSCPVPSTIDLCCSCLSNFAVTRSSLARLLRHMKKASTKGDVKDEHLSNTLLQPPRRSRRSRNSVTPISCFLW